MDDDGWHRVVVEVDEAEAELVADLLWRAGAAGIEEQATATGGVRLLAGLATRAEGSRALAAVVRAGHATAHLEPVVDDGLDGWRAHAAPVRAGASWLVAPWLDVPPLGPGERVVWLDPARTFGSGSHPTTRLVVGVLERLARPGARVLDVGCGSGVLAIVAALGGATVTAIDIDPGAPAATRANAERNGVADRIAASNDALEAVPGSFDLVAANLLAPVVAALGPDLVRCTAPDGTLVVSGLLGDRWEASLPHLAPLAPIAVHEDDGWVAVELRQPR
ncbi:MAG: 50S ribosomal protein L11 methyltransferase [Acidimicrobiales bacterium]